MSCPIESAIIGAANLILGLCVGYYISKKQQREFARYSELLRLKNILISDKVRLDTEVVNKQDMGNVANVQGVFESLKSIFRNTDLTSINEAWNRYYKNEHHRQPLTQGPARKEEAKKAIDSIIEFIEKNLH